MLHRKVKTVSSKSLIAAVRREEVHQAPDPDAALHAVGDPHLLYNGNMFFDKKIHGLLIGWGFEH